MKGLSRDSACFGEPQQSLVDTYVAVEVSEVYCYFDTRPCSDKKGNVLIMVSDDKASVLKEMPVK